MNAAIIACLCVFLILYIYLRIFMNLSSNNTYKIFTNKINIILTFELSLFLCKHVQ